MTIYRQVYQKIIDDIRSGKLKPGEKIASIRKYADENGISCNSVQNAYNQLLEEGYIYSREKSGFYVADFDEDLIHLEYEGAREKKSWNVSNVNEEKNKDAKDKKDRFREKQVFAGGRNEVTNTNNSILNLSANLTDSSLFPYDTLRRLYRQVLSTTNESILGQNGNFCGDIEFRKAIANYLYNHRGIDCSPEQIIIGSGTAALMAQLIKLF
nr:GntR family transcriptional regulator [Treponema sp.]